MDEFLIFLLCVAVIWLVARQAMLSSRLRKVEELRDLIARLEQRMTNLERSARPTPVPLPPPVEPAEAPAPKAPSASRPAYPNPRPYEAKPIYSSAQAAPIPAASILPELPPVPPIPPKPAPAPQPVPEPEAEVRSVSLEERLGQNWLNKLGIVSLIVGLALFLGYQLPKLGPLGKSVLGFMLSMILLGGGVWLERREKYRIFARAGIGGGWALTFFVAFAIYHVDGMQVLHSQTADLILMLAVAAAMVWHSLRYDSQVVTSLAFLLAFVTVGISHVTLFSLVAGALLAGGLVVVAARKRWFELALAGLAGAYLNHFLWLMRVLPDGGRPGHPFPEFYASAGLLLLYWLIYRLLFVLRVPLTQRQQTVSSVTAILNSAGLLLLLKYQSAHPEWTFRALVALGVVEFVFAFVGRARWRTSFIVLSTIASGLLLAAIPFRYSGAHWTVLWLIEAEILFFAGVRMPESVFRRLGLLAGFLAAFQIAGFDLLPILEVRSAHPDASRHLPAAIALLSAAIVFWLNSEFASRRWKSLFAGEMDSAALLVMSYLGAGMLTAGLWVFVPGAWTIVAWLAAMLAIAYIARSLASVDLATQADLLAIVALIRVAAVNFTLASDVRGGPVSLRALTVAIAATTLYAAMGRRIRSHPLPAEFVPAVYSWAASTLLAVLAWYEFEPLHVAIAWGVFGLILFELGCLLRRPFLRHQAYVLFASTFVRIFFVDLDLDAGWHPGSHRYYTVLPLIAAYLWVYERTRRTLAGSELDRYAGMGAAWTGLIAASALLYFEMPSEIFHTEQVVMAWAALALVLLYAGWLLRRSLFVAQSLTMLAATMCDAFLNNLPIDEKPRTLLMSRTFFVGTASVLMLLALPAAFAIRRRLLADDAQANAVLSHPEQPFFFVPLILIASLIVVEQSGGRITIGWIALGLVAFLAALPIGERSYRLAGLGLLLLGLAKAVFVDIWSATPTDRYLTLIVTGIALLLVSFLYSRYRETILKFL